MITKKDFKAIAEIIEDNTTEIHDEKPAITVYIVIVMAFAVHQ